MGLRSEGRLGGKETIRKQPKEQHLGGGTVHWGVLLHRHQPFIVSGVVKVAGRGHGTWAKQYGYILGRAVHR